MDLGARDRVRDRLQFELGDVADPVPGSVSVEHDLVRRRVRPAQLVRGDEERPRPAGVSADDRPKRLELLVARLLVDERDRLAAALVDRAWPVREDGEGQTVERHVAEAAGLDVPRPTALAVALRRTSVDVAGTAPVAVARDQDRPAERPAHVSSPNRSSSVSRRRISRAEPPETSTAAGRGTAL